MYTDKITLDESEKEELNRRLSILHNLTCNSLLAKVNKIIAAAKYRVSCTDEYSFSCGIQGQYMAETGIAWKVDMEVGQTITADGKRITFGDIVSVTAADGYLFDLYQEDRFPLVCDLNR